MLLGARGQRSVFFFCGRSPVGAPGRVAGGHFRRAEPSQYAHGCPPTGERLRGCFLVERNSFRFSVSLVPFERANRSAGKKRNEFRSTTPRLRALGKGQNWLMVDHLRRCGLRDQRRRDHVAELTGARTVDASTIEPPPASAGGRRSGPGWPHRPPSHRRQEEVGSCGLYPMGGDVRNSMVSIQR